MASSGLGKDLVFKNADGSKLTRIEMEQQIRQVWVQRSVKKLRAGMEYGLPNKQAQDLKPAPLLHWLLDEMVRKGQITGPLLDVNPYNGDGNEEEQLIQRLTALIEQGHALKPDNSEGLSMSTPFPAPPAPGQIWAPPAPPGHAPPPPPPPGPAAYAPPPQMSTFGPPPGAPPAPVGFAPPPPPPGAPMAPPTMMGAPPAEAPKAGRRGRPPGSTNAPAQAPASMAMPIPNAPMQMQHVPMPVQQIPMPVAQAPMHMPPQQMATAGDPALANEIAALRAELAGIYRTQNMIATLITLSTRIQHNKQGGWDMEELLREFNAPIPPR